MERLAEGEGWVRGLEVVERLAGDGLDRVVISVGENLCGTFLLRELLSKADVFLGAFGSILGWSSTSSRVELLQATIAAFASR